MNNSSSSGEINYPYCSRHSDLKGLALCDAKL